MARRRFGGPSSRTWRNAPRLDACERQPPMQRQAVSTARATADRRSGLATGGSMTAPMIPPMTAGSMVLIVTSGRINGQRRDDRSPPPAAPLRRRPVRRLRRHQHLVPCNPLRPWLQAPQAPQPQHPASLRRQKPGRPLRRDWVWPGRHGSSSPQAQPKPPQGNV